MRDGLQPVPHIWYNTVDIMRTEDFNYELPAELIAQTPLEPRDASRLLVCERETGNLTHRHFLDLHEYIRAGDVLVFNDSRVIPARLRARKPETGGRVEILLLRRLDDGSWEALVRRGKRLPDGSIVELLDGDAGAGVSAELCGTQAHGVRRVRFSDESRLAALGEMPLPPYIHQKLSQPERYQTVYARVDGSAAAPTAGLHFTPEVLARLDALGAQRVHVTLHVGLDTFQPVRVADPARHPIHREYGVIDSAAAAAIAAAKSEGRRVLAVGTTSVRLLEAAARAGQLLEGEPYADWADIFILPGFDFRVVDAMLTNFHLPRSTLLMLVSAFAGKELIDRAYAAAVKQRYRFYSFGDAMLLL